MSPPNSRWSSLVFFSELLHLSLAYLFLSFSIKKTSSRNFHSFLFDFCSAYFCIKFLANLSANSSQIFVRSYLTSELRWQVFFSVMNSVSPNCHFRSNRIPSVLPKHATRCHRFRNRKTGCHIFYISSGPAPLNESCPPQASQFYPLLCTKSQGPNLFDGFQEKPSWKLMSKGEREITSKLIIREREITSKAYHLQRRKY